jgi:hypothetical protein
MSEEWRMAIESAGEEAPGSNSSATAQPVVGGDQDRRARLYELDRVLDSLEQLNLKEAKELPPALRRQLAAVGLRAPAHPNFTALIEGVWELQEQLLLG